MCFYKTILFFVADGGGLCLQWIKKIALSQDISNLSASLGKLKNFASS